jgi:hypothetical protein
MSKNNRNILNRINEVLIHWDRWEPLLREFNLDAKQINHKLRKEAVRRVTRMTYGRDNLIEKIK